MKSINLLLTLVALSIVVLFSTCSESDGVGPSPVSTDSADLQLSDEQLTILEAAPEKVIHLQDIFFENGENVKTFLEMNDPDFLQLHPSGRSNDTKASTPREQKMMFLARMYATGLYLADDDQHTYTSGGADKPAQTGLAYSWGSKDYNKRQVPPTQSGCMNLKIYGLDCSGMLWAMTQAAKLNVVPKYNFFVEYITDPAKWTDAFKASADYKDLRMKDMGQLPQDKIKNGDIILWRAHVGVYLSGSFLQSNGTSKAPGCSGNLGPNRGPRIITLTDVLGWGLGSYTVFRAVYDLEFNLEIKFTDPMASEGLGAFLAQDLAQLNVVVKSGEVTTSDITNYDGGMTPSSETKNGCTTTWLPPEDGFDCMTVTKAAGYIEVNNSKEYLAITVTGDRQRARWKYECKAGSAILGGEYYANFPMLTATFLLKDSVQTFMDPTKLWFVTLTPK